MDSNSYAPKRIFLGLILTAVLFLCVVMYYLWYLGTNQETELYRVLFTGIIIVGFILMGFIIFALSGMVLTIIRSRSFSTPIIQNIMRVTIGGFFPVVMQVGRIFHIQKIHIMQSFIQVNNQMVLAKNITAKPENILLLLPHCVQDADCKHKITRDINNCVRCGICPVKDLIELSERHGVALRVATGGTLARQIVKSINPKVIVAVACERDLVSGILDCMPLPVFGVLNHRPNGPCFNTQVIMEDIEQAISIFNENCLRSELDAS